MPQTRALIHQIDISFDGDLKNILLLLNYYYLSCLNNGEVKSYHVNGEQLAKGNPNSRFEELQN